MSVKKRGLGKGLSALISEEVFLNEEPSKETILNLDIDLIVANESQPRQVFDKEALKELSSSIQIHGVIQPIIVRKTNDKYEIIAGERRWRASKKAGLKEIPCIVKDMDEDTSTQIALIENVQREDLNPIEEAIAYKRLLDQFKLTQEEVARQIGKSRSYITNTTRLLNLHEDIIDSIANGELTSGHGKVLLGIKDKEEQLEFAKKIINNNLNVRETEEITKKAKNKKDTKTSNNKDPYIRDMEEDLMRIFGTKVNLRLGDKKGKIEIEYYNNEDLERIIEILVERG